MNSFLAPLGGKKSPQIPGEQFASPEGVNFTVPGVFEPNWHGSVHIQCLRLLHQAGSNVIDVINWVKQEQGRFDLYNESRNNALLIKRLHEEAKMKFGRM